jgi:hypothetical protein
MKPEIESPTATRESWLIRFQYVLVLDDEGVELEIEMEHESKSDAYLISIYDENREIDEMELHKWQIDELKEESMSYAEAIDFDTVTV